MIHTEVVIFGKGIAGLILSFLLSRNNIKHVIIDRSGEGNLGYGETLPPSAYPYFKDWDCCNYLKKTPIEKLLVIILVEVIK